MATKIQLRRGNSEDWISINPVLSAGEIGVELDTKKFKFGDGVTAWNSLPYPNNYPVDIPTKLSQLENDENFITIEDVATAGYTKNKGTVTSVNNILPDTSGNVTVQGGSSSGGIGFSCWENKTATCVGDSITYGSGTTDSPNNIYATLLKDLLSLSSVTRMGVAGSCVSATSNYGQSNSPLINRYGNIPNTDIITIFMGTNDYGHNTPLGTIADTTDISFYGALNVIIPGILTAHPNSRLVWITPTRRYNFGGFKEDWQANGAGNTLGDYVKAIKDVCERYSIPTIDLYSMSGLNPVIPGIKSGYTSDGLHLNNTGHHMIAVYIAKQLNTLSPYMPAVYTNIPVTGVSLNNSTLTIQSGHTETLLAAIAPSNATNSNVTWSIISGDESITLTPNGVSCTVTAKTTLGSAKVRVTTEDGGYTAECNITVIAEQVPVTGVTVSGLDGVLIGNTVTLTANVEPNNASNKTVSWLITSGNEYVSITPNDNTCIVTGISTGSADISVTTQDGSFTATKTIAVTESVVPVASVEITGASSTVETGKSIDLTATITPANATNKNVTWSISSGSSYASITPNGLTCTVTGVSEGPVVISVMTEDGSYTDTYEVQVEASSTPIWKLTYGNRYGSTASQKTSHTRLTPSECNYYFYKDDVVSLTDNVNYKWQMGSQTTEELTNNVTWKVGGTNAWTNTKSYTIPSDGYYTVALLKNPEADFILVPEGSDSDNAFDYIGVQGSSHDIHVTDVTITGNNTIVAGDSTVLTANVTPANATNTNVTWSITSGNEYVTIATSGNLCTVTGTQAGTAVITATAEDGGITDSYTVTINASSIAVTGVEIFGEDNIKVNGTTTLSATITPSNASNKNVTWSITQGNSNIAITPDGLSCLVRGLQEGSGEITVTTQDGSFTDTLTITVAAATPLEWELDYGNRYGTSTQTSDHKRASPKTVNYYFEAGDVVTLNNNVDYKWQMAPQTSETEFTRVSKWVISNQSGETSGGWTQTKSWTIPSSGYYALALLKNPEANFVFPADGGTDSTNAFDYISLNLEIQDGGDSGTEPTETANNGDSSMTTYNEIFDGGDSM